MKKLLLAAFLATAAVAAVACGDDDSTPNNVTPPAPPPPPPTPPTNPPTTDGGGDAGGNPPVPKLGAQIDRMGRPAVNTAANNTFNPTDATKGAAKDEYNQNSDPTTWSKYVPEAEKNLAILDALDTNCGNQFLADTTKTDASRYGALAGVLANDRLWVKADAVPATGATTACTTYLAVEANATNLIPNGDCGGRVPSYEVMKQTYSVVAVGATSGVTDGTTPVDAKSKVTTFPYLGAPTP
jgi:hypothetical protein